MTTAIVDDQDPATPTTLTRSHAYDVYGRLSTTTYPSSVTVEHEYNDRGYPAKLKHGATALVDVTAQTAYGQSKAESYGNGVRTRRSYDEPGRLTDIDTIRRGAKIQDNTYAWRSDGSLQRRTARAGSRVKREYFAYDYLNRLKGATTHLGDSTTASRTLGFGYDLRGNLETKTSDVSSDDSVTNTYPKTSNRLSRTTIGDVEYRFTPDTSGHIERYACWDDDEDGVDDCADVDDTFIEWNARGLAEKATVGESADAATPTARDSFRYGPDGARHFKKSEWAVESGTTTTMKTSRKYYAGAYEKTVTVGGDTVERVRIGDSVVHVKTTPAGLMPTPSSVFEYVHRDHLGSVEAVTDASGNELVVLGYDPYGERRKPDWTARLTRAEIEILLGDHGERVSRGFTGHEHLDRTGLIHMNGRVYDPRLGRFLSPDPIVGDPTSSQSWNLYSYVKNNPLEPCGPDRGAGAANRGACRHGDQVRLGVRGGYVLLDGMVVLVERVVDLLHQLAGLLLQRRNHPLHSGTGARGPEGPGPVGGGSAGGYRESAPGKKGGASVRYRSQVWSAVFSYHLAVEYTDPVTDLSTTLSAEKIDGLLVSDVDRPSDHAAEITN